MGHADLIGIGKAKGEPHVHLTLVLDDLAQLPADVAAGLLHLQEQFFYFCRIHGFLLFFQK